MDIIDKYTYLSNFIFFFEWVCSIVNQLLASINICSIELGFLTSEAETMARKFEP